MNNITKLVRDIKNDNLPKNLNNVDKIHAVLKNGNRIYWYYQEDMTFFLEEGLSLEEYYNNCYSGIVVAFDGVEVSSPNSEIDFESCVVIMDVYPIEKEYPECQWVSMKRILDQNDLVQIVDKEYVSLITSIASKRDRVI